MYYEICRLSPFMHKFHLCSFHSFHKMSKLCREREKNDYKRDCNVEWIVSNILEYYHIRISLQKDLSSFMFFKLISLYDKMYKLLFFFPCYKITIDYFSTIKLF